LHKPHFPESLSSTIAGSFIFALEVLQQFFDGLAHWSKIYKKYFVSMSIIQITVQELAERLASNHAENHGALQLIDVRERDEVEIAAINGFTVLPLSEYDQWASDFKEKFDPNVETLVLCHHGMRSAQMCQWLINQGFTNVKNISGGIDAYAYSVDLNMAKY